MEKQEKISAFELLANHEEVLGQLYEIYGIQQSKHVEYWKRFHREEEIHAQWIRAFIDEARTGNTEVSPKRFPTELISNSINHVISLKNEAMQGGMSFVDQLTVALGIERELLEDRFFEVLDSDDPHLKIVLDKLRIATDVHRERLSEELEKQVI